MEDVKLVEKLIIVPERPTECRRMFLSNLDLGMLGYEGSVSFFAPPANQMSFSQVCQTLCRALSSLLVPYDFLAGRLAPALGDSRRFEIECNGAGMVVAIAKAAIELSRLGELYELKAEYRQLTTFLYDESDGEKDICDMPLLYLQVTQFGCGSLALAIRFNHCVADGMTVHHFLMNFAAVTRGDDLFVDPNSDRTVFRARNPPIINHPHYEYSKAIKFDDLASRLATTRSSSPHRASLIHLSPDRIASLKKAALLDNKLKTCTAFQVVAARIWKARIVAMNTRRPVFQHVVPDRCSEENGAKVTGRICRECCGPGYARMRVSELIAEDEPGIVRRVQEGIGRVDYAYIRSSIDWLEVNRGGHWGEDNFSVVAMWRLGLDEEEFVWGKPICNVPIELKPGMVALLPGPRDDGGINVWVELDMEQVEVFRKLMLDE